MGQSVAFSVRQARREGAWSCLWQGEKETISKCQNGRHMV